ncbi:flavodoxin family protein [Cellulosilyticum sp. I15G10I2]|uniref:flavodoxin family protein n=1 Tax=Cellulosilyticum sp. I15G10I2 TaxID=1892843 RepID=UPI00085C36BA|nr:NAD(P)H-dependent oxidoreductase [Cellulosilyticum sp. I15G10I2]
MHILVVNGSPKGKGNTYKVAKMLEEAMKKRECGIEFEYLHLRESDLKGCLGCYRCLADGEAYCPLQDNQMKIEAAMQQADAVIFATPVYVMNVSWLFKNFLDRFAYICHRPRFHGKKALVLSTTGALGTGIVNTICKYSVGSWGFETAVTLGAAISPGISQEDTAKQWIKIQKAADQAAEKFVMALKCKKVPKAGFFKLYAFRLQKAAFGNGDRLKADYNYWKEKGWLDPGCNFYIQVKINLITHTLANALADLKIKSYPKGVGDKH